MNASDLAMVFLACLAAGLANALAGGGTFFSFPAMLAAGLPPTMANATSSAALMPGYAASMLAQWRIGAGAAVRAGRFLVPLAGGFTGAVLLLATSERAFMLIVPWLLLLGTLTFIFSRAVGSLLRHLLPARAHSGLARVMEFLFSVYGGYFGAGVGVLLMAVHVVFDQLDVRRANILKNVASTFISITAVAIFALAGKVSLPAALAGVAGALPGGWLGGRLVGLIPPGPLRAIIGTLAVFITLWYFARAYWL
jgi:hypothetical protein